MVIALSDHLSATRRGKADLGVADTPERTDELRIMALDERLKSAPLLPGLKNGRVALASKP